MKFLLVAVNAKYIHSNPAVYSLKTYADYRQKQSKDNGDRGGVYHEGQGLPRIHGRDWRDSDSREKYPPVCVEIAEYTINTLTEQILEDIYERRPDAIGFSCYIWNINDIWELVRDIHKILPGTDIWLGGPEVSFDAPQLLAREPEVLGIMKGEGEETFAALLSCYRMAGGSMGSRGDRENEKTEEARESGDYGLFWQGLSRISGIAYRTRTGEIRDQEQVPVLDLSKIPFYYKNIDEFENRIIYYESSRGCPFSCSYCLSSIDKSVRFRDLEMVKRELDFFLRQRVPQVKFVDRTFNCKKSHAMEIWQYILDHDNGITNFHFEVAADLMDQEELELIGKMRRGLIQLEIGVQSTNMDTIREIRRKMDLEKVRQVTAQINRGQNVHQHLDLIVGLPWEDYESFHRSFNEVYEMEPEQLQVGFLKVLKGSHMYSMASEYGLVYREKPPYEVLSTRWLSYDEVIQLKGIEDMVEVYYNSGQFTETLKLLVREFGDAFVLYEEMARYYKEKGLTGRNHSRMARYEILYRFAAQTVTEQEDARGEQKESEESRCRTGQEKNHRKILQKQIEDALVWDCYLRENCKSRPFFALDQAPYKEIVRTLAPEIRSLGTQVHAEVFRSGEIWLFDYRNKDPLTRNAAARRLR